MRTRVIVKQKNRLGQQQTSALVVNRWLQLLFQYFHWFNAF
jgi:hypothetical protein